MMLITIIQCLMLAPFPVWKKWDYSISKGEKALQVVTPLTVKVKDKNGLILIDNETEQEVSRLVFTLKPVFDISQTKYNGNDLDADEKNSGSITLDIIVNKIEQAGYIIEFKPLKQLQGGYIYKNKQIVINEHHTRDSKVATILHEVAHEVLGHLGSDISRDIKELEAECTAYCVGKFIGIDIPSQFYIASWNGDGNKIRKSLVNIDKAVNKILTILKA